MTNTIIVGHQRGFNLDLGHGTVLISDYNLLDNVNNYDEVARGVHDITNLDAQFVDVNNYDFHLSPISPAINKGTLANAPSVDFENVQRPNENEVPASVAIERGTTIARRTQRKRDVCVVRIPGCRRSDT